MNRVAPPCSCHFSDKFGRMGASDCPKHGPGGSGNDTGSGVFLAIIAIAALIGVSMFVSGVIDFRRTEDATAAKAAAPLPPGERTLDIALRGYSGFVLTKAAVTETSVTFQLVKTNLSRSNVRYRCPPAKFVDATMPDAPDSSPRTNPENIPVDALGRQIQLDALKRFSASSTSCPDGPSPGGSVLLAPGERVTTELVFVNTGLFRLPFTLGSDGLTIQDGEGPLRLE